MWHGSYLELNDNSHAENHTNTGTWHEAQEKERHDQNLCEKEIEEKQFSP